MKSCALRNLGCKVNEYETEAMKRQMQEAGYEIVPFEEAADVYVVNTCSVTNIADRKSRQMLHQARKKNPDAVVVAAGCYVQAAADDLLKEGCADILLGNDQKGHLAEAVAEWMRKREDETAGEMACYVSDIGKSREVEELVLADALDHTRAFIKIQDGCNQFCSYCIIPYTRGRVRSRRPGEILREVERVVEKGYREVVLTGIHISSYGLDFVSEEESAKPGAESGIATYDPNRCEALLDLLFSLEQMPGLERVRLGSLEPRIITPAFVEGLKKCTKFCPHFHLSLQSGCDETLRRMNRHYTTAEYEAGCRLLREAFEHPAITTDVITGFAGETEEEFATTTRFLEGLNLYEIHVFPYSVRKGTRAQRMPGQNTESVKKARSRVLLDMTKRQSREFRAWYIGRGVDVLLEEQVEENGRIYSVGHTKEYVKVAFPGGKWELNTIVHGNVKGFLTNDKMLAE
ncbi:MAG: MiaB/RimO family radical SAM methylthiotransferase [Lachnospiraceae bacterium]|nr:MiaB/RimO family radical SAM methylthiotransferase [Lachnospiraceae bacterium]